MISDGRFFRVTFRSNDKLDGNGFLASYRFTGQSEGKVGKKLIELDMSCAIKNNDSIFLIVILLLNLIIFPKCHVNKLELINF